MSQAQANFDEGNHQLQIKNINSDQNIQQGTQSQEQKYQYTQGYTQTNLYNNYYTPIQYQQWYNNADYQTQLTSYTPQNYYQWYYTQLPSIQQQYTLYNNNNYNNYNNYTNYGYQNPLYTYSAYQLPAKSTEPKKTKLSRNQKRKLKKQELKKEYAEEQKKIGKWVKLQRKDLLEDIAKIQQAQRKQKQKKKQKLSHLIEIHKQIYKHMIKKNQAVTRNVNGNKNNGFRRRKKQITHARKMKMLYKDLKTNGVGEFNGKTYKIKQSNPELSNNQQQKQLYQNIIKQKPEKIQKIQKIDINNNKQEADNDNFITDSQQQQQQYQQQVNKQQKQQQQPKYQKQAQKQISYVSIINYKQANKLTNHMYNNMVLREWVDHMPSAALDDALLKLINRLAYKQAINKINKPQKAKKLIVAGVHECRRTLWTKLDKKRSKLVIVALNIQRNQLARGIDDQIQQALDYAKTAKVPVIHSSTRNKLGRAFTGKFGPKITMVSIINHEGYQDCMDEILKLFSDSKKQYEKLP